MEKTTKGTAAFADYENQIILGIDPSLNSTGLCVMRGDSLIRCYRIQTGLRGIERIAAIRDYIVQVVRQHNVTLAAIEGYVYGRSMMVTNSFELHELGGVIKAELYEIGIPYYIFAPTSLKKFVTGNARKVKKEDMIAGISSLWNLHFSKKQNDIADAYALAKLCYFANIAIKEFHTPLAHLFMGTLQPYQIDVVRGIKTRKEENE